MDRNQYFQNLTPPAGKIDVVLDTDAYNEIDDQYAISYMVLKPQKFNVKGICAAPFSKKNTTPDLGMEQSYQEIFKLLDLARKPELKSLVLRGSKSFLPDEATPVDSPAAEFMAHLANEYSPEHPLYVVAIGAITNVASAILKNPKIAENCVLVWLGGHACHIPKAAAEYNMKQDVAAARVVMGCGAPLVQLPCAGVVEHFSTTKYELQHWLKGKNALCDYLCENTIRYTEALAPYKTWSKPIWDVTALAWLCNEGDRFMMSYLMPAPIPQYDLEYAQNPKRPLMRYVYKIKRDALFEDLFNTLVNGYENL